MKSNVTGLADVFTVQGTDPRHEVHKASPKGNQRPSAGCQMPVGAVMRPSKALRFGPAFERGETGGKPPVLVYTRISEPNALQKQGPKQGPKQGFRPRYIDACADNQWHLKLWRKDSEGADALTGELGPLDAGAVPLDVTRIVYRCRSRRHEGPCQRHWSSVAYSRITSALKSRDRRDVAFVVLTLKREDFIDEYDAYRQLFRCWRQFSKIVTRTWPGVNLDHVQTVEQHRSGWPHLNVVLVHSGLSRWAGRDQRKALRWVKGAAARAGFGYMASIEQARSKNAVAGYVTKLATELGGLSAEVTKISQAPVNAPAHFRTLRSSKGLLPPRHKNPEVTGCLIKARLPAYDVVPGDWFEWPRKREQLDLVGVV